MNTNSKISTLLKELRKERQKAAEKHDAKAVKKIDFIGKSINRLIDLHATGV